MILNAFKPNTYSCCSSWSLLIVYVMTCNVFLSAININVIYNIYISIYIYINMSCVYVCGMCVKDHKNTSKTTNLHVYSNKT